MFNGMWRAKHPVLFIYGLFISILLLIYTFFIPPFRKYDEHGHFQKTMILASGQFACRTDPSNTKPYISLPQSVEDFIDTFNVGVTEKFPISLLKQSYPYHNDKNIVKTYSDCQFPIFGYAPQILGALASYPFNNLLVTFYLARFFSALFFAGCLVIGYCYVSKRYRIFLLVYASFPVVLHQVTIVSYDASILSLSMILFALFTRYLNRIKISFTQFVLFCVVLLVFLSAKTGYYFLALLPLWLIPKLHIQRSKKIILFIFLLCGFSLFLFWSKNRFISPSSDTYLRYQTTIHDPLYFFQLLYNSLWRMQRDYLNGMFASLGWHDYDIVTSVSLLYFIIIGAAYYRLIQVEKKALPLIQAISLLGLVICSVVLICYLFYIYSTPFGQTFISGPQGRYFLPLILFGLFALSQIIINIRKRTMLILGGIIIGTFITYATTDTIYYRYYDYSRLISNGGETEKRIKEMEQSTELTHIPLLDTPVQYLYEVDSKAKIGGIEFMMVHPDQKPVTASYKYVIMDSACKKHLVEGYLDQSRIQNGGIYTEYFNPVPVSGERVCIVLSTMPVRNKKTYLNIFGDKDGVPIITFLYQSR